MIGGVSGREGASAAVKLLVAFDERRIALALCNRICDAGRGEIVGQAVAACSMPGAAEALEPDVLLLQHLPHDEDRTWRALADAHRASAATRVLLLADSYSHLALLRFIEHGVAGCVLSSGSASHCAEAVLAVARGEPWFRRSLLLRALRLQVMAAPPATRPPQRMSAELTTREQEIMQLAAGGHSNKEIGRRLAISDKTVKTHLHNIYTKLNRSGRYKVLTFSRAE